MSGGKQDFNMLRAWRFSMRQLLGAVVVCAVVLAGLAYVAQPIQESRSAAQRMSESGHFSSASLELLNRSYSSEAFPPAKNGAGESWRISIVKSLRYHEFQDYDVTKPWNDPANDAFCRAMRHNFAAPDTWNSHPAITNIVMPTGPGTVGRGVRLDEITDDHATTILLLPLKPSDILWHEPRDVDISEITRAPGNPDRILMRGHLFTGGWVATCDGRVKWRPEDIPYDTFHAMLTIDGGEEIDEAWVGKWP